MAIKDDVYLNVCMEWHKPAKKVSIVLWRKIWVLCKASGEHHNSDSFIFINYLGIQYT